MATTLDWGKDTPITLLLDSRFITHILKMGRPCFIARCPNSTTNSRHVSFFRFPKDSARYFYLPYTYLPELLTENYYFNPDCNSGVILRLDKENKHCRLSKSAVPVIKYSARRTFLQHTSNASPAVSLPVHSVLQPAATTNRQKLKRLQSRLSYLQARGKKQNISSEIENIFSILY